MSAARRRKARDRTRAWREARQDAGVPEAREIDRALAAALMHVVMADQSAGRLPKAFLPAVVHVAAFILEEGHDRRDARMVVEDRLRRLGQGREVMHARERASVRRTEE